MFSQQIPSERENVVAYTLRKPLGVFGLVTPWNFPSASRPGSWRPRSCRRHGRPQARLARAALGARTGCRGAARGGRPRGRGQPRHRLGHRRGQRARGPPGGAGHLLHRSCEVGKQLYDKVAARRLRVQLEMGGKNPTRRAQGRRRGRGGGDPGQRRVPLHRPEVHLLQPGDHREADLRQGDGAARGPHPEAAGGQRPGARRGRRPRGQRAPAPDRSRVRRDRQEGGRRAALRAAGASPAACSTRATSSSRRSSRA
jgi:hypothetical protein